MILLYLRENLLVRIVFITRGAKIVVLMERICVRKAVSDMATCKECIHEKLCVIKAFPDAFENTQWDKEPCDHFKRKADFEPKTFGWEMIPVGGGCEL